jgi:hypothetical protein
MRPGLVPVDVDVNGFLGATLSYYPFMRRKSHSPQVISHYEYHPGTGRFRCKLGMRWKVRFGNLQ